MGADVAVFLSKEMQMQRKSVLRSLCIDQTRHQELKEFLRRAVKRGGERPTRKEFAQILALLERFYSSGGSKVDPSH